MPHTERHPPLRYSRDELVPEEPIAVKQASTAKSYIKKKKKAKQMKAADPAC